MKEQKKHTSAASHAVTIVCLLACAVGAWGAARKSAITPNTPETITYAAPTTIPTQNTPVDVPVTGIPYTETETQSEAETETQPPKTYQLPLGDYITKDYSPDKVVYSNTMHDWRVHTGIDFGDNRGQSVLAMADGTVTDVRKDVLGGVVVTIDHGDGIVARYGGLEEGTTPEPDTTVEQGVVIGKLGEIPVESKDGPHLHLEVTQNGKRTDPWRLLNA